MSYPSHLLSIVTIPAMIGLAIVTEPDNLPRQLSLSFACDSTLSPNLDANRLAERYGPANLSTESIHVGEGRYVTGTVLFPADSVRRVEIMWKDTVEKRYPSVIRIQGQHSSWQTPAGLTVGMQLLTVERINRRPFRLAGFGFDGSGYVSSWSHGALEDPPSAPCTMHARLSPGEARTTEPSMFRQVVGDRVFSSGHPAMQALNPVIYEILLRYH